MTRPTLADWVMEPNRGYGEKEMPEEMWKAQSAVEELRKQFARRRDERRGRHQVPEVLYHYTDLRGAQGMFSSFNMWLSDAAYMNDPLEGTWVHHRASVAVQVLGESPLAVQTRAQIEGQLTAPDLWDQSLRSPQEISHQRQAAMFDAFMPAFIASFTEEGDLLSQWRGYGSGGEGVAIGFNLRELSLSKIEGPFLPAEAPAVVKVEYDQDRQDQELRWHFEAARRVYDEHAEGLSVNQYAARRFPALFHDVIRDALYWLRWEFKSPYYSEEREWRLVSNPVGLHYKTRFSNGSIVPYVEMPLPQKAARPINEFAVPRIVLGPRCPASATRSFRTLLTNLCYPEIVRSNLALR